MSPKIIPNESESLHAQFKEALPSSEYKLEAARKRRRHWHQHEKLSIIGAYDRGDLLPVPGKPNFVVDPKSKEILSVFIIENWKDSFRTLGIISKPKDLASKVKFTSKQFNDLESNAMQNLLMETLLENQKLKEMVRKLPKVKED